MASIVSTSTAATIEDGNDQTKLVAVPMKLPASISDRADIMFAVLKEMQARLGAYRVQINEGLVYVTANVTARGIKAHAATHNALQESFSKTKSNTLIWHANAKSIFAERKFQVSAISAAGGAAVMGAGGGAVGMTAGFWIGGAIGIVPALFTFGLSIPVGAAIGAGTGLVVGTAAGSSAGALGGGAVGYGVYSKRQQIGGAVEHAHNTAGGKVQHARAKTT